MYPNNHPERILQELLVMGEHIKVGWFFKCSVNDITS
jgi:hypothetical protein